jgi:hypothetical protein
LQDIWIRDSVESYEKVCFQAAFVARSSPILFPPKRAVLRQPREAGAIQSSPLWHRHCLSRAARGGLASSVTAAHVCRTARSTHAPHRPLSGGVAMTPTAAQIEIIEKLNLRGTLLEQFIMQPGVLSHPERYVDSPSLMRFAMDVCRALKTEGWELAPAKNR